MVKLPPGETGANAHSVDVAEIAEVLLDLGGLFRRQVCAGTVERLSREEQLELQLRV